MTTPKGIPEQLADALHQNDFAEFRRLMLAYPENLREPDGKQYWLSSAAQDGRLEFVKYLVGLGIGVNESHDEFPEGAILQAADEGHLEVVRWFLDKGAKINFEYNGASRCSPLLGAVIGGHFEVVKLLVERGANVNALGPGLTPLSYALMYNQEEIADYLRSVGAKEPFELVPPDLPAGQAAILKHFEKHRGRPPGPLSLQEIVPGDPPIAIHVIAPTAEWEGQTLFTTGMSDRPLNLAGGGQGFAELAIYLPKDWPLTIEALGDPNWAWPIHWLRRIARCPHETGIWPGGSSIVFANEEPPEPLAPNTKLSCILCLADPGDFGQIQLPDQRLVTVYSLYAIYTEERDLEKREGTRPLIELFEKHKIPRTVSVGRANVALLKAESGETRDESRKKAESPETRAESRKKKGGKGKGK